MLKKFLFLIFLPFILASCQSDKPHLDLFHLTLGTEADAEVAHFCYMRYNLLSYLENGVLPIGEGNLNSVTQDVTSFTLGSDNPDTTKWGTAIQMPMLLGLPVDSEVNLIVASEAGFTSEISFVTPFLYNIRYFKSTN